MKYRNFDPYWLNARFESVCRCGKPIRKGERVFYYPNGRTVLCVACSGPASAEFAGAVSDEAFMSGGAF